MNNVYQSYWSSRANEERMVGYKRDFFLIKDISVGGEYGVGGAGTRYQQTDPKSLVERSVKLPKVVKDMLDVLVAKGKNLALQVFGICTQVSSMHTIN
jgi:hypothetical protein